MEQAKLRILLVEEDEREYQSMATLLSRIPGAGYSLDWVRGREGALDALRNECHDVCLVHRSAENGCVPDLLEWARKSDCRIPIIVLLGSGHNRSAPGTIHEGAFDCIPRDEATPWVLDRSICHAVGRRKAEEALRESEERFRFMAENSGDVLYRLRYDSMRYDYLSPSIEALTGYTREEMDRIGFSSLVLRIDMPARENVPPALLKEKRLAGTTGEHKADYLIRTRSGAFKWLSDHSVPWMDRSGALVGSTGILADITERRHAEDAVRDSEKQLRFLSSKLLSVQEAERTRLARSLHDSIGQSLAAVKYGVENALKGGGENRADDMARSLEPVVPVLQNLIDSVRSIYMDLRPTLLDDFGIVAAIEWLCREFQASHATIELERRIEAVEGRVPADLKSVIYRIARDAVDNIARHSKAARALLAFKTTGTRVELEVKDDGIGFEADRLPAGVEQFPDGLGICSMRERARLTGGSFTIRSKRGRGTMLRVTWPTRSKG